MPFSRVSDVLRLREFALRRWLPFHRLRRGEFLRRFARPRGRRRGAAPFRVAVLFSGGELVDDGHLDVAGSSLTLDRSVRTADRPLAFAGKHDPKLVAEVVLEVYQPSVWIDVLRSCVFCFVFVFAIFFYIFTSGGFCDSKILFFFFFETVGFRWIFFSIDTIVYNFSELFQSFELSVNF